MEQTTEAIGLLRKHKCAECGKEFFVRFPNEYVYKRAKWGSAKGRKVWLCSWHCLLLYDKAQDKTGGLYG